MGSPLSVNIVGVLTLAQLLGQRDIAATGKSMWLEKLAKLGA
jgi:hypothetical protein